MIGDLVLELEILAYSLKMKTLFMNLFNHNTYNIHTHHFIR